MSCVIAWHPSQTDDSARMKLTVDRLYSSETRMKPPAVPSPETVVGMTITASSSNSRSN